MMGMYGDHSNSNWSQARYFQRQRDEAERQRNFHSSLPEAPKTIEGEYQVVAEEEQSSLPHHMNERGIEE